MHFELDVESKLALAQAGFKPVCALGPGLVGERWLFNNSLLGQICGELVSAQHSQARVLVTNIQAVNSLEHVTITKIVRSGELAPGVYGVIFEISPADQRLVSSFQTIDNAVFRKLLVQLAGAVNFLHRNGVVHSALSPHVVIQNREQFQLSDFWWAQDLRNRPLNAEMQDDVWEAVPRFAAAFSAPELISGGKPSRESDIFSLGAVLYWTLSGNVPRPAGNERHPYGIDTDLPIFPLWRLRSDIDRDLASLIHLMLDNDPLKRPIAPWVVGMTDQILGAVALR